jgi:small subunit ribosomal protein S5
MEENKELQEKVLHIRRVSRKVPGGNYVSFSALVAVGDMQGGLGIGLAKALEVPKAIEKALHKAKKRMIKINLKGTTIPYDTVVKYNASKVLLKPAAVGTGLKVGSVIRSLMEIAGVKDLSGKILGSNNKINLTYAIFKVFKEFKARQK